MTTQCRKAHETVLAREVQNGEIPIINANACYPDEYPYFKEDLKYVKESLPWGEGNVTYNDLGTVAWMAELYVNREINGEPDYLYIENKLGEGFLFSCGWGCPATLNHVEIGN